MILHPDGNVEDSWGVQPLAVVLERFHIDEYKVSNEIFIYARARQIHEYPDRYKNAYEKAISLLSGKRSNPEVCR